MKSFNQFVKNRSKNYAVNENDMDMNPHVTVPGNGLMNQLRHAQGEMNKLHSDLEILISSGKGRPIDFITFQNNSAKQSHVIADIIKGMPEEAVREFYKQGKTPTGNSQNHNQM